MIAIVNWSVVIYVLIHRWNDISTEAWYIFGDIQKHNNWVNEWIRMEEHKKNKPFNGVQRGVNLHELESDFIGKIRTTHTLRLNTTLSLRPKAIKNHNPNKNISLEKKNSVSLCLCDLWTVNRKISNKSDGNSKTKLNNANLSPGNSKICSRESWDAFYTCYYYKSFFILDMINFNSITMYVTFKDKKI